MCCAFWEYVATIKECLFVCSDVRKEKRMGSVFMKPKYMYFTNGTGKKSGGGVLGGKCVHLQTVA